MKLIFDTLEKAEIALNQININKGYSIPSKNAKTKQVDFKAQNTETWDEIIKVKDLWYVEKPEQEFMDNIQGYKEQ